jgi:hypothetical protein
MASIYCVFFQISKGHADEMSASSVVVPVNSTLSHRWKALVCYLCSPDSERQRESLRTNRELENRNSPSFLYVTNETL